MILYSIYRKNERKRLQYWIFCREGNNMNEDMKNGAIIALQGVKEEINTIILELRGKGMGVPRGFSILKGYIDDRMNDFKSGV